MGIKAPYSLEAEQAVISSMFIDREAAALAVESLEAEEFYDWRNQRIFKIMQGYLADGVDIDVVTIKKSLEDTGDFMKIGGLAYLAEVAASVGSSVNVKSYMDIVREKANRRKYLKQAEEIQALAYHGDYEKLEKAADSLSGCGSSRADNMSPVVDIVTEVLKKAIDRRKAGFIMPGECTGLQTGFLDLDAYTGGLQSNNLIVLAARPSMGKSALAVDIAVGAAKGLLKKGIDKNIAIFSLEMSRKQITTRICSAALKINNDHFKLLEFDDTDIEKMERSIGDVEQNCAHIYIDDTSGVSARDIYAKCHTLKGKSHREIGLIVIDYLQLMTGDKSVNNREQEIAGISREMKSIAKKFNCPVLLLAQLNRNCESRADRRPLLSDLRESGAIEQDADIVMFLYRDEYYFPNTDKPGEAELIIAKHRDGATGTIKLAFINNQTTFRNLENGWNGKRG